MKNDEITFYNDCDFMLSNCSFDFCNVVTKKNLKIAS